MTNPGRVSPILAAWSRLRSRHLLCDAEVENLHVSAGCQHDDRRLQVAVPNPLSCAAPSASASCAAIFRVSSTRGVRAKPADAPPRPPGFGARAVRVAVHVRMSPDRLVSRSPCDCRLVAGCLDCAPVGGSAPPPLPLRRGLSAADSSAAGLPAARRTSGYPPVSSTDLALPCRNPKAPSQRRTVRACTSR